MIKKIKINNKAKKIFVIFLLIFMCVFMCIFICKDSRKYINITYVTESDYNNLEYFEDYKFPSNCEFTWWWHFPSKKSGTIKFIDDTFGTTFTKKIQNDINTKKFDIIISFGRKIKTIYYDKLIYTNGSGAYSKGMILAVPVFEKQYRHKIYLYVTPQKYNIYPAEFVNDDISQFNMLGNVRFDEE